MKYFVIVSILLSVATAIPRKYLGKFNLLIPHYWIALSILTLSLIPKGPEVSCHIDPVLLQEGT
jgi:hypothetical protein